MAALAVYWFVWCCVHSLLISNGAQRAARSFLGRYFGLYRLGYIVFSVLSLIPILGYQYALPQQMIFQWHGLWRALQAGLLIYAGVLFYFGGRVYDMGYFFGITQWRQFQRNQEIEPLLFHSEGILGYVRHPWYGGGLAFLLGFGDITDVSLTSKAILSFYLIIGTLLEEKRLKKELGRPYVAYCRTVPMLIPWRGKAAVGLYRTPE